MNCPTDEMLRALLDGELAPAESAAVDKHIAECPACQSRSKAVSAAAARVGTLLGTLNVPASSSESNPQMALARFKARLNPQEERVPFLTRIFAPRWRFAWAASLAAVILAGSLAFPSARSFAQRLLATLRIEKVQTVTLDFASMDSSSNRKLQQGLGQMISDNVVVTTDEKEMDASSQDAASKLTGFPVKLLSSRQDSPSFRVAGAHAFHMTVDRARLQEVLDEAGRTDLILPANLDGAQVSVQVPRSVEVSYGNCSANRKSRHGEPQADSADANPPSDCLALIQAPSPTVNMPAELDLQQLAETALQLAGMTPVQARKFCQTIDWRSTLVLPIPRGVTSYEPVSINGIQGTLMRFPSKNRPSYALIWVDDGIIYGLVGWGDPNMAVQLASSLD
jgi:putative zinc finger protein